ncbi:MAG: hypothetical protein ACR2KK_19975 [Acidimicrobiales bacterium]
MTGVGSVAVVTASGERRTMAGAGDRDLRAADGDVLFADHDVLMLYPPSLDGGEDDQLSRG